ncbi:MAG: hypothetical protein E6I97_25425 [Chloroflexi bacterium]|nr:MAG: hypothetical protein E6I97_25425 [Chloroflexota bacterium]
METSQNNTPLQSESPRKRRNVLHNLALSGLIMLVFMIFGIMFLGYSTFIFVFGVGLGTTVSYSNGTTYGYGPSELASLLRLLAQPAILIGLGLLLVGFVNRTKKYTSHRLRDIVTILGLSLIGLAVLVALFMIFAVVIASALFP